MGDGGLVERLTGTPVGPKLAALLASIDVTTVPNGLIVDVLQASARQRAHTEGVHLGTIASTLERDPCGGPDSVAWLARPDRYAAEEVRAALMMTRRQGWGESEFAWYLCRGLPLVHQEMLAGRVDRGRALVFVHHLAGLPAELVAKVLNAVLAAAPGLTTGQLRARILKLILTADPDHAEDAYERALGERAVVGYLNPDGTAVISATGLPPDEAAAATERIAGLARAAKRAGHPGLVDQLRADIYLRLLDGRFHHLTRAQMIAALLADAAQAPAPAADASPAQASPAEAVAGEATADTEPTSAEQVSSERDSAEPSCAEPDDGEPASVEPDGVEPGEDCPDWSAPDRCGRDNTGPADDRSDDHEPAPSTQAVAHARGPLGRVVGIEVRARLDSLAGINELPGEIPGWGPTLAETTRKAVARQHRGQWRWAVTDHDGYLLAEGLTRRRPTTGPPGHLAEGGIVELAIPATVLARLTKDPPPAWASVIGDIATQCQHARITPDTHQDTQVARRFPSDGLRRYVQIRDRTCSAPGCRRPATQSEQDHTHDHQYGGPTSHANLGPGCKYDHRLKHEGG